MFSSKESQLFHCILQRIHSHHILHHIPCNSGLDSHLFGVFFTLKWNISPETFTSKTLKSHTLIVVEMTNLYIGQLSSQQQGQRQSILW